MRLRNYINESLTSKLDSFEVQTSQKWVFSTMFRTDTLTFYFEATFGRGYWEIAFTRYDHEKKKSIFKTTSDTSKKETLQVFTGVKKSLELFLKKYDPEEFEFQAQDKAHIKAYDTMSRLIAKKAGYEVDAQAYGNTVEYHFVKKKK